MHVVGSISSDSDLSSSEASEDFSGVWKDENEVGASDDVLEVFPCSPEIRKKEDVDVLLLSSIQELVFFQEKVVILRNSKFQRVKVDKLLK